MRRAATIYLGDLDPRHPHLPHRHFSACSKPGGPQARSQNPQEGCGCGSAAPCMWGEEEEEAGSGTGTAEGGLRDCDGAPASPVSPPTPSAGPWGGIALDLLSNPHPQLLQRSRQGCVPRLLTSLPTTIYPSRESEATLSPEMRLAWPHWAHLATPSVLVQDEGHLGAVHLRRQPLAGAHVEHGQRGQWPGHLPTGCHLPQLLCVPADGAVVDHLDAGGTGPAESSALGINHISPTPPRRLPVPLHLRHAVALHLLACVGGGQTGGSLVLAQGPVTKA